nr:septum formation initiator family protein [Maliibacterium massiliense]
MASKRRFKLKKRGVLLISMLVLTLVTVQFVRVEMQINAQKQEKAQVQEQIGQMRNKNADLQQRIEGAGTQEAVEQAAREKLGWVREGEILFVDDAGAQQAPGEAQNQP